MLSPDCPDELPGGTGTNGWPDPGKAGIDALVSQFLDDTRKGLEVLSRLRAEGNVMGRWQVVGTVLGGALTWAALADAQDEPPPLTPPAETPAITIPHPAAPEPSPAPTPPETTGPQPILVIPGLPVPRVAAAPRTPPAALPHLEPVVDSAPLASTAGDEPPPLVGPTGSTPLSPVDASPVPPRSTQAPLRISNAGPPPLVGPQGMVEGTTVPLKPAASGPSSAGSVSTSLTLEPALGDQLGPLGRPSTSSPRSASSRTFDFAPAFGRRLPFGAQSLANTAQKPGADAIRVEPKSDPEADVALQHRIEQQVRAGLGNQVRGLNVFVSGHSVTVHARVVRFWQKRFAKRYIESMPLLNGHQAYVEVTD